jgi:hypothetical protein
MLTQFWVAAMRELVSPGARRGMALPLSILIEDRGYRE